jgi:Spy/CpxP family protein refolding chaperone
MKAKWLVPLLIAVIGGAIAFGVVRHTARCAETGTLDQLQDISFLTRELKLSAGQADRIKALHTTLSARLDDSCDRHCAARAKLAEALARETDGEKAAEAILADMCRAYEEGERATLEHLRQVRAALDPGQKKRFDDLIGRCLCRECGGQGAR